jgi:hypothetical protein
MTNQKDDEWHTIPMRIRLTILANESTVHSSLLVECEPLMEALRKTASEQECLRIINEHF